MKGKFTCLLFLLLPFCKVSAQSICDDVLSVNNKLINGSFESGLTGWNTTSTNFSSDTYWAMCGGSNGLLNPAVPDQQITVWQRVNSISAGTPLTFKGYAGTHNAGLLCSPYMAMAFYNASNTLLLRKTTPITTSVDVSPWQIGLHSVSEIAPAGTSYVIVELSITCDYLKVDAFSLLVNNLLLPLQLTSFSGVGNYGYNTINWATENETNLSKFEIESSVDGNRFAAIGNVEAATTPRLKNDYTFKHFNISGGKNFYRLKVIDKNGSFSYSKVITINGKGNDVVLSAYPNPFLSNLSLQWNSERNEMVVVKLLSATGELIHTETKFVNTGANTIQFNDMDKFSNGLYIAELYSNGAKIASNKIVKN